LAEFPGFTVSDFAHLHLELGQLLVIAPLILLRGILPALAQVSFVGASTAAVPRFAGDVFATVNAQLDRDISHQ
jgi:hypothetical protein